MRGVHARYGSSCVAILVAAAWVGAGLAQAPPPAPVPATPAAPPAPGNGEEPKKVYVEAEQIIATSEGKGVWIIDGNVVMTQGDTKMYCSHAVWDRNQHTAQLTNNVRIVPKGHEITADKCDVDLDEEIAVLTSTPPRRVHIISKREYEGDQPFEELDESTRKYEYGRWDTECDKAQYDYGDDNGFAEGNVVSRSEDGHYTFYSSLVRYEEKDGNEIITIPDNPRVETADDESYTCKSAVITTDKDDKRRVVLTQPTAHILVNKEKNGSGTPEQAESGAAASPPSKSPTPGSGGSPTPPPPTDGGGASEGGQG